MKKTLITLLALSGLAMGASTVTNMDAFDNNDNGKTGALSLTLNEVDTLTMSVSGGKVWGNTSSDDSWTNTAALATMNSDLGISWTAEDINALDPTGSGQGSSTTTLTLDINSITSGSQIVVYAIATAAKETMNNFSITGLTDATIQYATADGSGFSSTAAYTEGALNYTMFKITGTLGEDDLVLNAGANQKSAWGMLAYAPYTVTPPTPGDNVPEPTTATLSLLALAGLAARRRRK